MVIETLVAGVEAPAVGSSGGVGQSDWFASTKAVTTSAYAGRSDIKISEIIAVAGIHARGSRNGAALSAATNSQ
jgi:hypothetical protein